MSNTKKPAKTASKNNPTNRGAKIENVFNGQVVVPVMYINFEEKQKYTAVKSKEGKTPFLDSEGSPLRWNETPKTIKS